MSVRLCPHATPEWFRPHFSSLHCLDGAVCFREVGGPEPVMVGGETTLLFCLAASGLLCWLQQLEFRMLYFNSPSNCVSPLHVFKVECIAAVRGFVAVTFPGFLRKISMSIPTHGWNATLHRAIWGSKFHWEKTKEKLPSLVYKQTWQSTAWQCLWAKALLYVHCTALRLKSIALFLCPLFDLCWHRLYSKLKIFHL